MVKTGKQGSTEITVLPREGPVGIYKVPASASGRGRTVHWVLGAETCLMPRASHVLSGARAVCGAVACGHVTLDPMKLGGLAVGLPSTFPAADSGSC